MVVNATSGKVTTTLETPSGKIAIEFADFHQISDAARVRRLRIFRLDMKGGPERLGGEQLFDKSRAIF
jgi:hypothetical protein